MRIFITGGTGFIGTPAVRELLRDGHKLLLMVHGAGRPGFMPSPNLKIFKGDLGEVSSYRAEVRTFRPEALVHLAWEGIPDFGMENCLKNVIQSVRLFETVSALGTRLVVASGSCWEYLDLAGKRQESDLLNSENLFAAAKNFVHLAGRKLAEKNGKNFVWLRFFYVYGPGQKSSSLIPHLIHSMLAKQKPEIKNPGIENDFIYVKDVARALAMIVKRAKQSAVYNVGSGKAVSVGKITKMIYPHYTARRSGKTPGSYADISKIRKTIGWQPKTDIKTGIRETIKYFMSR